MSSNDAVIPNVSADGLLSQQAVNAGERIEYLIFWKEVAAASSNGTPKQAILHLRDTSSVRCAVRAIDIAGGHLHVCDLQTTLGMYSEALVRCSDIQSIEFMDAQQVMELQR